MTILIIILACIVVMVTIIACLFFRGTQSSREIDHQQLLVALHHQQQAEYATDKTRATLPVDAQAVYTEAQKNFLLDLPSAQQVHTGRFPWEIVPMIMLLATLLYMLTGAFESFKHWQEVKERLPYLSRFLLNDQYTNLTAQDRQDLLLGIRTKLAREEQDYRGWWLMGRLLLDMQQPDKALQSLEKAYALDPENTIIWLPYAQALALNAQTDQAQMLVHQILQVDPKNHSALILLGSLTWESNEPEKAIEIWSQLYQQLDESSDQARWLAELIHQSRQKVQESIQEGIKDTESETLLTVQVSIASVYERDPGAYLVVFVKDATTGQMPLLAKKITNPTFPVSVILTQEDAVMQKTQSLTEFTNLTVSARLVVAEDVRQRQGAFEASMQLNQFNITEPVSLSLAPHNE